MSFTQRLLYESLRTADTADAATDVVIGGPLEHPASLVKMVNLSNKDLIISIDDFGDVDICPANGFWLYDITTNSPHTNNTFIDQGRQYKIRTSDDMAGTGLAYLVVLYIKTNLI